VPVTPAGDDNEQPTRPRRRLLLRPGNAAARGHCAGFEQTRERAGLRRGELPLSRGRTTVGQTASVSGDRSSQLTPGGQEQTCALTARRVLPLSRRSTAAPSPGGFPQSQESSDVGRLDEAPGSGAERLSDVGELLDDRVRPSGSGDTARDRSWIVLESAGGRAMSEAAGTVQNVSASPASRPTTSVRRISCRACATMVHSGAALGLPPGPFSTFASSRRGSGSGPRAGDPLNASAFRDRAGGTAGRGRSCEMVGG
jgi:hypothetical protein